MSEQQLEYLIDRKNQEIHDLRMELRALYEECKFGAWFMFFLGNVVGVIIGGLFIWP